MNVFLEPCSKYDPSQIHSVLERWDGMFAQSIHPGNTVILKPNWIASSHKYNAGEWQPVITHPSVITEVLRSVLRHLAGSGRVVITDGPQTQSSWDEIMKRMTAELWVDMGRRIGVQVDILDLRQDEWRTHRDVIVARKKLPG